MNSRCPQFFHDKEYVPGTCKLKRVMTGGYHLNLQTGTLRYGGASFKASEPKDHWDRRQHVAKARERFFKNPVVIEFGNIECKPTFFQYRRLEQFIRECFYRFGVEGNEAKDPMKSESFQDSLKNKYLPTIFDPELTRREKMLQNYAGMIYSMGECNCPHCNLGYFGNFSCDLDYLTVISVSMWLLIIFFPTRLL